MESPLAWLYKGRSLIGTKQVQIKILKTAFWRHRRSIGLMLNPCLSELRLVQRLQSSRLSRHLAAGATTQGQPFLVREALSGLSGTQFLSDNPSLALPTVVGVIADVAEFLESLWDAGVRGPDLRPSNLRLTPDPRGRHAVHIVDMGACVPLSLAQAGLPLRGQSNPCYMSREEADGRRLSAASDVYALGALFYELLTGRAPLSVSPADAHATVRYLTESGKVPSIRLKDLRADASTETALFIKRCLHHVPEQRPSSTSQILRGLAHVLTQHTQTYPEARIPPGLFRQLQR